MWRKISPETKTEALEKIKNEGLTVKDASSLYGVSTKVIYQWLGNKITGDPNILENNKLKKEIKMLRELIGKLTIELDKLKKNDW
jgi:transposase-like protein